MSHLTLFAHYPHGDDRYHADMNRVVLTNSNCEAEITKQRLINCCNLYGMDGARTQSRDRVIRNLVSGHKMLANMVAYRKLTFSAMSRLLPCSRNDLRDSDLGSMNPFIYRCLRPWTQRDYFISKFICSTTSTNQQ